MSEFDDVIVREIDGGVLHSSLVYVRPVRRIAIEKYETLIFVVVSSLYDGVNVFDASRLVKEIDQKTPKPPIL